MASSLAEQAREMKGGAEAHGVTISSLRDDVSRAQQEAKKHEKMVAKLMAKKEYSDLAIDKLNKENLWQRRTYG